MREKLRVLRGIFSRLVGLCCVLLAVAQAQVAVNVTTQHYDNARSGQNTQETQLTPTNVNSASFGKMFSVPVDGYVYAQPLYLSNVNIADVMHNVAYVATEHDSVYAIDADGGSILWHVSFINPSSGVTTVSSSDVACNDLVPEIGITSTPVIDPASGTIYVLAKTKENAAYVHRLHALDVTSGAEKFGGPVVISASVSGTGDGGSTVQFDPLKEHNRPGLLLQNGQVIIGWASHCDITPFHGWIMSYNASTLAQEAVFNTTPNGGLGGVWQGGGGLAGDSSFNTYFATGNGTYDGSTAFGDSVVKLGPPSGGSFPVLDWFTPDDQASLETGDVDLGSGGVLLLPDQPAGSLYQHLLVEAGKEGTIYLIDRDNMGHYNPLNNNQSVQNLPGALPGEWGLAAWWSNNLYFVGSADVGGDGDYLKEFAFDTVSDLLSVSPTSQSSTYFLFPGPTPTVSANGTSNGIVWVLQNDEWQSGGPTVLHAYDATDVSKELYNSQQNVTRDNPGPAVKFTLPVVVNGKVYVGTQTQLSVYGQLPLSLTLSPTSVVGGNSSTGTVTLNAAAPVGGAVVTLASNNAAAQVGPSVTVAAGATTATFTVTTSTVGAVVVATISATYNSSTQSATLTVNPVLSVTSVSLNPASVVGGSSSTGTVTLNAAAPVGGAVVTLASNNAAAQVGPSVTVAAGAATATFTVTTSTVGAVVVATISATYNSSTQSATLTVNPVTGPPAVAFVRDAGNSGESVLYTVSISPTAGDFLVVFVWQAEGATTPSVTDNLGSIYNQDCDLTYNQGSGVRELTVYHLLKAPSGITGVNITPNKPSRGIVAEYSGMPTSGSLLDVCGTVNNQTSPVTSWSSTATTTTFTDLVFGLADTKSAAAVGYKASGAWTGRLEQSDTKDADDSYFEDQISMAAGSYTGTGTTVSSVDESSVVVAFKTGTAPVASVTLNPTSVVGGSSSTGTVTLNAAAPVGGAVVTLASNNAAAQVGPSVTVAAGATTATFTVTTSTVGTVVVATISATYNSSTQSATLTVNPVTVTSVSLNPTSVVGGSSSTGTVTLNAAAPVGGAVVTLASNNAAAQVGPSVTVAAGATTATFTVTTSTVGAVVVATISATYNSSTQSATLTVNPVTGPPAVAFVRDAGNSGESVLYTVSISPTAGDFLVVFVWQAEGATTPSVTDNLGSIYNQDCDLTYNQGSGVRELTVYHLLKAPSGITGVNITPHKPSRGIVAEYSGMPTSGSLLDVCGTVNNQTSPVTSWSSTATTTTFTDLVFGLADTKSAAAVGYKASGAWTGRLEQSDTKDADDSYFEDQISMAAGSYTGTGTTVSSVDESSVVVAFKTGTAPVASVTLNPTSVVGGSSSTGTVTLNAAAPVGGAVVTLASNNAAAQVGPSVTVAAGATTATFTVTTSTVGTVVVATISATYNSSTQSATLTVNPVTVTSISLNPTSVVGGSSSTGTVTLNAAAPVGGAVVTLASNNAAAQVGPSVTVAAGATTATFTVTTSTVGTVVVATISATYNSSTQSATLTVNPVTVTLVSLNPTSVVGGSSSTGTVTLNAAAPVGGAVVTLASNNAAAQVGPSVTVAAGATTATFTVTTSTVGAVVVATISATYNSSTQSATLTVNPVTGPPAVAFVRDAGNSGESVLYTVSISPTAGDFLVVFVWQAEGATTPSVTDNLGSIYNQDCDLTYNQGSGVRELTVYHLLKAPSGITGVNITPHKPSRGIVAEYSGMPTSGSLLDVCGTVNNQTSPVTSWSSTATTTTFTDLVFGLADTKSAAAVGYKASGAWTGRLEQSDTKDADDSYFEDQISMAAGSYTGTGTTVSSVDESSVVVAFKTGTAPVASVTLNPTSVVGGSSSTGTVTLNAAAPVGGAVVTLASNNAAAQVGPSVTVAAGAATATFTVTTSTVGAVVVATISATYNSSTQSATLTVNPVTGPPAVAFVRDAGNSGESVLYTVSISPTAGDFLVVFVWQAEGATTPSVTDNLGSIYNQDCDLTYNQGSGVRELTVYHLLKAPSGITGVNITPHKPSRGIVAEYSGMPTSGSLLDVCGTVNNQTSPVTSWSSTATTTTFTDLVFGLADTKSAAAVGYKASGAWTGRLEQSDTKDADDSYFEDQISMAAGSYTGTGTTVSSVDESSVVVAFKTN